jgi:hypothetical protein
VTTARLRLPATTLPSRMKRLGHSAPLTSACPRCLLFELALQNVGFRVNLRRAPGNGRTPGTPISDICVGRGSRRRSTAALHPRTRVALGIVAPGRAIARLARVPFGGIALAVRTTRAVSPSANDIQLPAPRRQVEVVHSAVFDIRSGSDVRGVAPGRRCRTSIGEQPLNIGDVAHDPGPCAADGVEQ